jgi:hypothetical protein
MNGSTLQLESMVNGWSRVNGSSLHLGSMVNGSTLHLGSRVNGSTSHLGSRVNGSKITFRKYGEWKALLFTILPKCTKLPFTLL